MIWSILLGGWGWLKNALSATLELIRANPWPAAVIALAALSLWFWHGKRTEAHRANAWHTAFDAQKHAYEAAQAAAQAKQDAADAANFRSQIEQNRSLDRENAVLERASSDAVARYIATHRLRPESPGGAVSGAGAAGVHPDPAKAPDAPAAAELVAIRSDELEQITAKAMRDTEHQQFLNGLVEQGLAVPQNSVLPEVKFGKGEAP